MKIIVHHDQVELRMFNITKSVGMMFLNDGLKEKHNHSLK